jgi:K+-transporting ATPase A subunit
MLVPNLVQPLVLLAAVIATGAVNSFHDSYTAAGGLVPTAHMLLGEVSPGPLVEQLLQGTGRLF